MAIGQTRAGRYLRVVYVPDPEPESLFVITTPRFLLLTRNAAAATDSSGYLGLLHPQEIKDPYAENVAVTLRFDGVQRVVPYQSSTVYYLDNGILKHYVYSGD